MDEDIMNWQGSQAQGRNPVRGLSSNGKSVEIGYVEGANRWGAVNNGLRGIFAMGFSGQNEGGTGAETKRLPYPWKGETGGRKIKGEKGVELSSS